MATATKKKKFAVIGIQLEIGGKTITLSPDELMELRDVIDKTFPKEKVKYVPGKPIVIKEVPTYPTWPYRRWDEPTWLEMPKLTCDGDASRVSMQLQCKS